jgi:adenine-specific DNA-methyltransferase
MRPDVGTQAQFKKRKPPATYRYDSSLSPALDWDGQNPAREQGEKQLSVIEENLSVVHRQLSVEKPSTEDLKEAAASLRQAEEATRTLKALSKPFLNWAGKAERLSFDVPTLPLFVHERLSTKAIVETLTSHRRDKQQTMFELFGDPQHSVTDQVLRAYEHRDKWVNRMMLGDSLAVMNSLLHYEGLGGQVQMIYMDPPYGVKFGSNFQPFVRKRDVSHNDDEDMTREPEMVQAYRDTWELGLHSYLTYLRDRLLLARELLAPSGSIFVQISDENLHHVREVMDDVFHAENFVAVVCFVKATAQTTELISSASDYLIWYVKDRSRAKYRQVFLEKQLAGEGASSYGCLEAPNGKEWRRLTRLEKEDPEVIPAGWRVFSMGDLTSQRPPGSFPFQCSGQTFTPGKNFWKTSQEGLTRLADAARLVVQNGRLYYKRYLDDFACYPITTTWTDTSSSFAERMYVVQTTQKVVQRCLLMTTDPGDLVLDPTCGSGTTAYVAEQWGRRWITIDTSRVPLALARQRLLTATFPWYELNDDARGPAGGFVYIRKQNKKGEEVGGIVPHVTLESIANNEPPKEEVLVDRPEPDSKITRVTGPFCVEATIPTPVDALVGAGLAPPSVGATEDSKIPDSEVGAVREPPLRDHVDRMLEVLRKSPMLRLEGNRTVTLKNIRPPAKTLSLSAEALVDANGSVAQGSHSSPAALPAREKDKDIEKPQGQKTDPALQRPVALVFGPENGAISEALVRQAAYEASAKRFTHLYVIGFAIQPTARQLIENADAVMGIPATYVQATPDLMMGDLLKNMRSSQIFSVCGLPEIKVHRVGVERGAGAPKPGAAPPSQMTDGGFRNGMYQVELLGLDVFDPITMETHHRTGEDVPAWFLDTDYNGLCFHVSQAFFPRTSAWDNLKKALKGEYEESVWDHLAGAMSAPFEAGEHRQISVKVIDDRGNELMVVEKLG